MRVIKKRTLQEFWKTVGYEDSEQALKSWYKEVERADWIDPSAVKAQYRSASILKYCRVVFNIAGNKYRLVVKINYPYRVVYIRFVGTHEQYDAINAETV